MPEYRIDPYQLQILPEGMLQKGIYFYRVSAITADGVVDLVNTLKVYAPYTGNAIGIFWDSIPGSTSYRLYRRAGDGEEKSIFVSGSAFFFDTGAIEFE